MKHATAPSLGYHFVLLVGAPPGSGKLRPPDRFAVFQRAANRFPGFFIQEGEGSFRGHSEDCLRVEIATLDAVSVVELAEEIREALRLEAVGVSWAGIYQRVLDDSDPEELVGKWNLPRLN